MDPEGMPYRDVMPPLGYANPRNFPSFPQRFRGELQSKVTEELLLVVPSLLAAIRQRDQTVAKQSIANATSLLGAVLEEIALQLHSFGRVDGWLQEVWSWMLQFKDAVCSILMQPGSFGLKVLALKFIEIFVLYFVPDEGDDESRQVGKSRSFNVSQLTHAHPIFSPAMLEVEGNRALNLLVDVLRSAKNLHGSLIVSVINSLAVIAKSRPLHYNLILSALVDVIPDVDTLGDKAHSASVRYCLRTAILNFLRSNHPSISESKEKLLKALRLISPGEPIDLLIRQAEKISRSMDRSSRDVRINKDDMASTQFSASGDKKRHILRTSDAMSSDMPAKRAHFSTSVIEAQTAGLTSNLQANVDNHGGDDGDRNHSYSKPLNNDTSPLEQMIATIGALLAEGDKGAGCLEILISTMQADVMADIVMETMKHLPENLLSMPVGDSIVATNAHTFSPNHVSQVLSYTAATPSQELASSEPSASTVVSGGSTSDMPSLSTQHSEFKRDPKRDPRRLDPRRVVAPVNQDPIPLNLDKNIDTPPGQDHLSNKPIHPERTKIENGTELPLPKIEAEPSVDSVGQRINAISSIDAILDDATEGDLSLDDHSIVKLEIKPDHVDQDLATSTPSENSSSEGMDGNVLAIDEESSTVSAANILEDTSVELPKFPPDIQLTDEQTRKIHMLNGSIVIEDYKKIRALGGDCKLLLTRLLSLTYTDGDIVDLLRPHIIMDYQHQKGHELMMHVLYELLVIFKANEQSSFVAAVSYEKLITSIAQGLLDSLPASDKSFNRLLCEAPFLPGTTLRLLEDICQSHSYENHPKDARDGDRVTQGLGTVWSIILARPTYRQACLDIALKCTLHSQDEVRNKAIRLVANKLYLLDYASNVIEQFATSMLLSVVDHANSETENKPAGVSEQPTELMQHEASVGVPLSSEPSVPETESTKETQTSSLKVSTITLTQAQWKTSLFFALCTKKPSLLQLVFDIYGRAPKAVKQSIHRHVPNILRTLGSSNSDLLRIISNPPEGSESLIALVLQILTEESTPSFDLIATVKHLFETKLKDAAILIPMLSSLSKAEVLPIFPHLVALPLEKFQAALARILQGSAHSGPALTPAEVLIALHDIRPGKDSIVLKKITDACTACFEQRTVFTQQVLSKALSCMVEQVPLPLLFMRTVIQAVDAFPTLVDFVMDILSKLVTKQIWKMPQFWAGFLKCASQTIPHSFPVLLQLPPPQLEGALNKHPNLRSLLVAYANQPHVRPSLPREILEVL